MRNPRIIEALYSAANIALVRSGIVVLMENNEPKPVIGEYEGYIAGFGATVINMGIKPAIAAYCGNAPDPGEINTPSRKKVIEAIAITLNLTGAKDAEGLLKYVINHDDHSGLRKIKENIVNASVALKILVRTYPIAKDKD